MQREDEVQFDSMYSVELSRGRRCKNSEMTGKRINKKKRESIFLSPVSSGIGSILIHTILR